MKLKDEHIVEILEMSLEDAYKAYMVLCLDYPELKADYDKIRYGVNYEFDIYDVFEDNIIKKPKMRSDGMVIINKKKIMPIKDFRKEIEDREALMKKALIDNITEEEIVKPRV